jgi:integrase
MNTSPCDPVLTLCGECRWRMIPANPVGPGDPLARACYCRGTGPDGRHPCASSAGVGRGEIATTAAGPRTRLGERGQPIEPRKLGRRAAEDAAEAAQRKLSPGLEPKTVVNTHRMLHWAWEDFTVWGWAERNIVSDAHPPRVPRKGRKVWTVAQLQRFLQYARSDRFFALWVLEATSGMRRCELAGARLDLLDLDAGTLSIEITRVVVDGRVVEYYGKTENAQHVLALDPFTLAVLKAHVEQLARQRRELGPDYQDHGVLFCWPDGRPPHPDTITRRFKKLAAAAGLPEIDLHDVRHSYATAGRDAKIDWKALSQRIGQSDVAFTMKQDVQADLEADRQVATTLAELIIGGSLVSMEIGTSQGAA